MTAIDMEDKTGNFLKKERCMKLKVVLVVMVIALVQCQPDDSRIVKSESEEEIDLAESLGGSVGPGAAIRRKQANSNSPTTTTYSVALDRYKGIISGIDGSHEKYQAFLNGLTDLIKSGNFFGINVEFLLNLLKQTVGGDNNQNAAQKIVKLFSLISGHDPTLTSSQFSNLLSLFRKPLVQNFIKGDKYGRSFLVSLIKTLSRSSKGDAEVLNMLKAILQSLGMNADVLRPENVAAYRDVLKGLNNFESIEKVLEATNANIERQKMEEEERASALAKKIQEEKDAKAKAELERQQAEAKKKAEEEAARLAAESAKAAAEAAAAEAKMKAEAIANIKKLIGDAEFDRMVRELGLVDRFIPYLSLDVLIQIDLANLSGLSEVVKREMVEAMVKHAYVEYFIHRIMNSEKYMFDINNIARIDSPDSNNGMQHYYLNRLRIELMWLLKKHGVSENRKVYIQDLIDQINNIIGET
jgi:hypothetical protein